MTDNGTAPAPDDPLRPPHEGKEAGGTSEVASERASAGANAGGPAGAASEAAGKSEKSRDEPTPRARAKEQLLVRWRSYPTHALEALDRLLDDGLGRAEQSEPEVLTVMNPVSRPVRLRLAPIAADADLDRMYHRASAELSVSVDGRCYLVYRQLDGGDYAVLWSAATSLPEALLSRLPEPLAIALLESDLDDPP